MEIDTLQIIITTFERETFRDKLSVLNTVFNGNGFMAGHIGVNPQCPWVKIPTLSVECFRLPLFLLGQPMEFGIILIFPIIRCGTLLCDVEVIGLTLPIG